MLKRDEKSLFLVFILSLLASSLGDSTTHLAVDSHDFDENDIHRSNQYEPNVDLHPYYNDSSLVSSFLSRPRVCPSNISSSSLM